MKKILSVFLSALLMMSAISCIFASAEGNFTVQLKVRYGQTEARSMLSLINEFRTGDDAWYWNSDDKTKTVKTNLGTLEYDYELEQIAMQRAAEIAIYFDHTRPGGKSWSSLVTSWTSAGENIAAGPVNASGAFELLQETDYKYVGQGHRRNMLNSGYTAIGIGHVVYNGVHYWAQEFRNPKSKMESVKPLDAEKLVDIEINPSFVSDYSVGSSSPDVTVHEGQEASLPTLSLSLRLSETWPLRLCPVICEPDWSVEDTSAALTDGVKVTGVSGGETKLTAHFPVCDAFLKLTVTPHEAAVDEAVPATCVSKGLTEGSHCRVCNKIIKPRTETDILPHKYEKTEEKTSCTEEGYIKYTCSVCGDVQFKETEPLNHKNAYGTKGLTATCTEDGFTGGIYCPDCREYLSGHETIKAEGHKEKVYSEMVPATCFSVGHTAETRCSVCGETIIGSRIIEKKPHTFKEYFFNNDSTCTQDGTMSSKCEYCDAVDTITAEKTMKDHETADFVVENTKHGCTEEGSYDKVWYCTVCGEEAFRETVITPAEGHCFTKYIYNMDAACTQDGTMTSRCDFCDSTDVVTAEGSKLGHNYKTFTEKATLSKNGMIKTECSFCGDVTENTVIVYPKTVSLSATSFVYNGKVQSPALIVKGSDGSVISSKNYTAVRSNSSSKAVGTYTVKVTFKGDYTGTKTLTYKILPGQVTGLKAAAVKASSVRLTWTKVTGAKYYKVERSTDGKKWTVISSAASTNSFTASNLKAGTKYQFRVTALDSSKKLSGAASAVLKTGTLTSSPSVTLTAKSKSATASWKKVGGATKYIVYKSTDGKKWTKVTTTTKTTYNLTKLTGGKKIYVKVTALNAYSKESAPGAVKSVTVRK